MEIPLSFDQCYDLQEQIKDRTKPLKFPLILLLIVGFIALFLSIVLFRIIRDSYSLEGTIIFLVISGIVSIGSLIGIILYKRKIKNYHNKCDKYIGAVIKTKKTLWEETPLDLTKNAACTKNNKFLHTKGKRRHQLFALMLIAGSIMTGFWLNMSYYSYTTLYEIDGIFTFNTDNINRVFVSENTQHSSSISYYIYINDSPDPIDIIERDGGFINDVMRYKTGISGFLLNAELVDITEYCTSGMIKIRLDDGPNNPSWLADPSWDEIPVIIEYDVRTIFFIVPFSAGLCLIFVSGLGLRWYNKKYIDYFAECEPYMKIDLISKKIIRL